MPWISKKAKRQMRDRKKKKEGFNKRKIEETDTSKNWEVVQKETIKPVTIPSTLSTKDARKMRKEARRAARREGRDETKIKFVDENGKTIIITDSKKMTDT